MKLAVILTSFLLAFNGPVDAAPSLKEQKQIKCIATAIYFEARGSGTKGQAAVGQVTRNRVENPTYPKTYCKVIHQEAQFSWTKYKNLKIKDKEAWENARKIATVTYYLGWPDSLVGNATHFHSGKRPYWAKHMKKVAEFDGQKFYETKS